ncbi:hypothetical protein TcCL_Unassigned00630 [Trypanosoma cruzi]|nr:hypothetical protein TcCL_Unassigned00630 [Trypanosoma cruzi]
MILLEEVWFWCLLHGALPCVSVAVLPRDTEAFDEVFTLLFAPCSQCFWSWRQQWDSVAACSSHVSHLPLLLPFCVGGGVSERQRWWSGAPVGEGRHRQHD